MKIRQGFVSNSSSSSFVILKENLTQTQIDIIKNHVTYAKENFHQFEYAFEEESWDVSEKEKTIRMWTYMDNFDLYELLILIGVDDSHIEQEY